MSKDWKCEMYAGWPVLRTPHGHLLRDTLGIMRFRDEGERHAYLVRATSPRRAAEIEANS